MAGLRRSLFATVLWSSVAVGELEGKLLVRHGVEFQVNSFTIDSQTGPTVGIASTGSFVVAWRSKEQDGSGYGVFARRFDSAGDPVAGEFQVNSFTAHNQMYPRLGVAGDGSFLVVWQSDQQDAFQQGVFARRFDSAGAPLAVEFQVSLQTIGYQSHPVIAMQPDGASVIAWDGVFARRFGSDGSPLATQFQVSSYTHGGAYPAIAIGDGGDFVVAWESYVQDGDLSDVFAQRFDASGPVGAELQVNSSITGRQIHAAVGIDPQGAFVVAWRSFQTGGHDGIFARRFEAGGAPVAAEFQVNTATLGNTLDPAVVFGSGGGFVIAWSQTFVDGFGYGVFAREFDAAGVAVGSELQLNTYTIDSQIDVAVAAHGGDFVVAWSSDEQDHSRPGVFAQRLAEPAVLDVDADGRVEPLSDGLLILRFLFGFTGSTLTDGAVAVDCSRCDAAAIESYLDGLI